MKPPWYTTAFGAHYPLLYRHRDQAEARRCLNLLPRLAPFASGGPLLDLGCGDGRHLHQLAADHRQVLGLDLSPDLLAVAARRSGAAPLGLIRGDMRALPLRAGSLGGVLSLFTAFGYFGLLTDNAVVIEEVSRVLLPGGHWYLDYVDCDSVRRDLATGGLDPRRRELGPLIIEETRRLVDAGQRVEKTVMLEPLAGKIEEARRWGVDVGGTHYTESVALFSLDEMTGLAGRSGLTLVASAGSYEGLPLGQGSRWVLVFSKSEAVTLPENGHGG